MQRYDAAALLFNTPAYAVFLGLVVASYWLFNRRNQNVLLLAASYFFYSWWDWRFLVLIVISTCVDFFCARGIVRLRGSTARRALLTASVVLNLSFLGWFKYFNFFADSFVALLSALGVHAISPLAIRVVLPPAISFYTFQELAYIIDVYRGRLRPAASLLDYALFVSLFPHLIAGPIQQPSHLLPQVQQPRTFDASRFFDGLMLILTGLFRKCVIADNCALLANAAFDGRLGPSSLPVLLLGVYAFAWQVYGDFSGYSDIARGSAQLLGFHFMVNFRQPYLSCTLQEFWRRWHISLSTWLRDYLFLPVSYWLSARWQRASWLGVREDVWIYAAGSVITMGLGGLWHGASWTFVVWGLLFGLGLAAERAFWTLLGPRGRRNPLRAVSHPLFSPSAAVQRFFVFHFVCLCWVVFRARSLRDAVSMLRGATTWDWHPTYLVASAFLLVLVGTNLFVDLVSEQRQEEYPLATAWLSGRVALGVAMVAVAAIFAGSDVGAFIYFRF